MDEQQNRYNDHTSGLSASEPATHEHPHKSDFAHQTPHEHNYNRKKPLKKIAFTVVGLLVIATIVFIFMRQNLRTDVSQEPVLVEEEETLLQITSISEETEAYSSSGLGLSFDYPANWDATEAPGSKLVTVTSPIIDIPVTDTQFVSGRVVLTLSSNAQSLERFDAGNAVAVLRSEKITYTKPSSVQRGETYVSYLRYPDSTDSLLVDALYITGDFGYQKDQAVPKIDISKIDPITSIHFYSCDGSCETPLTISEEALINPLFGERLKNILKSLTIK